MAFFRVSLNGGREQSPKASAEWGGESPVPVVSVLPLGGPWAHAAYCSAGPPGLNILRQYEQATADSLMAAGGLAAIWLLAWAGYSLASNPKSPWKIKRMNSVDLTQLSGRERAKAIQKLADQLNALSFEERRRTRVEGLWRDWFRDMTEAEKASLSKPPCPGPAMITL